MSRQRLPEEIVARMYNDYLRLKSLRAVGKLHGRSNQALHEMFERRGWQMYAKRQVDAVEYKGTHYTPHGQGGYYAATSGPKRAHLHRLIWEEAHGPVPSGHQVHFKDGNKRNVELKNLELRAICGRSTNPYGENGHTKALAARRVEEHIGFIVKKARPLAAQYDVPLDDLIQCGRIGVVEASKRFDKKKGVKFLTYAAWWIRAKMQVYLRHNSRNVRRPADRLLEGSEVSMSLEIAEGLSIGDLLGAEEQVTAESSSHDLEAAVGEVMKTLESKDREIIRLHFFEDLSRAEIARRAGVSRSAIGQRLATALRTLRFRLKHVREAA